jgi:2-keto-4-pentenoate hydratase
MNQNLIADIARQLREAEAAGKPVAPVRALIAQAAMGQDLVATAYAVQRCNTEQRIADGQRVVGRKIGLTSLAVQHQLGVDAPDFGTLFAQMAVGDGEEIVVARTLQPKVEAEIALVLERDLRHEKHTLADVMSACAYAVAAIEVVGSRIDRWDIRLADTIADNASSGLFVLGSRPVPLRQIDLAGCSMDMLRGDQPVSAGTGAACLGNPLNAAAWLADTMVRMGTPLRAGDILMSGALGPMVTAEPGDQFTARIDGLGEVRAVFAH